MGMLQTDATESLARAELERQEEFYMTVINNVDWQATPIVDIVMTASVPTMDDLHPSRRMEFFAYESPAPPVEESAIEGERCEIARLTRPLINRLSEEGYIDPVNSTL